MTAPSVHHLLDAAKRSPRVRTRQLRRARQSDHRKGHRVRLVLLLRNYRHFHSGRADLMRAITVHEPMGTAIIRLGKTTENRPALSSWRGLVGDTIAIHAARPDAWNDDYARDVQAITGRLLTPDDVTFSAIIGTARVVDLHWARDDDQDGTCCAPWGHDTGAHLTLDLARPCTPIPCHGALGPWRVPDHAMKALRGVRT